MARISQEKAVSNFKLGSIYREILYKREFLWIRVLVIVAALSCFITFFYKNIPFSCQLSFIQNLLLPFFATSLFLSKKRFLSFLDRIKIGVLLGASFGAITATLTTAISNIDYYFLGVRGEAFVASNQPVPPFNLSTLWAELGSQVCIWLLLILISAFSGFIAALIPFKENPEL
jgi:hypothetical protein